MAGKVPQSPMESIEGISSHRLTEISDSLLRWYEANHRNLPWRKDQDPYKVWVSEVMLQQTRVDTVIPYFERFMDRFPTIHALSEASDDDVVKHWEGLGYYSRARNLHKAAREVQATYGGRVPDTHDQFSALPGVGAYTAGAVLSIAYERSLPAVDGNVLRVLSRIFFIEEDVGRTEVKRAITDIAAKLIPVGKAGAFNQSLMELGALVCVPGKPRCDLCPVAANCAARAAGAESRLPIKKKKQPPRPVTVIAILLRQAGYIALARRKDTGLLAGMWELPNYELDYDVDVERVDVERELEARYGIPVKLGPICGRVEHTFSHIRWHLTVREASFSPIQEKDAPCGHAAMPIGSAEKGTPETVQWVREQELTRLAMPVAYQKLLKALQFKVGRAESTP